MRNKFVETANVGRFQRAVRAVSGRAVSEHVICVVTGQAGFGKSRTGLWWSAQARAVLMSVSPLATPSWLLRDLVRELGDTPKRSSYDLKDQAMGLLAAEPRPIVIDEFEHALHGGAVALDAMREIADFCEVPLILLGREGTPEKLRRHRQIWRRIGGVAEFQAISVGDIRLLADQLAEVPISDNVVAEIHAGCEGRICTAIAGIATAEAAGKKGGLERVELSDVDATALGHPWAKRDAKVIGLSSARSLRRRGGTS